ncbi:MAG: tetratricopeptide repeat protein [Stenotrophomonas sp.]
MNLFWESLHFLRPHALWLLLLVPLSVGLGWYRQRRHNVWSQTVDAHLLRHLLAGTTRRSWLGLGVPALGITLAVLALAGPSWRQLEQPLWHSQAPLVAVLDLSSSISATDLQPSRLLQARAKLATLLRQRQGGEMALVVYAGEAFTVAPLTADAANVALFLDALAPEVIPVDGQRTDLALAWASTLLQQAGMRQGDILLMSAHGDAAARAAAAQAAGSGYRVSVLGLGTPTGAAYRDRSGQIQQTRLDEASLQSLAAAGNGRYARLSVGDADLQALGVLQPRAQESSVGDAQTGRVWRDEGYWLLPPLMLLALLAFRRRGGLAAMLMVACLLPLSLPAQAAESTLWQRPDQIRQQRLAAGVAAYRQGDFGAAQQRFEGVDSDQGWYNLGNALARQGKYDEAIDAYDRALRHQPGMADAIANRAAVEAARKRKQQDQKQGQQDGKQDGQKGAPNSPQDGGKPATDSSSSGKDGHQSSSQKPPEKPATESESASDKSKPDPAQSADKPQGEDAKAQQQADQAQRERMQQALQQQPAATAEGKQTQPAQSAEERERRQAIEAWMRRVPDEPGNLLKTKFQLEYERRKREGR